MMAAASAACWPSKWPTAVHEAKDGWLSSVPLATLAAVTDVRRARIPTEKARSGSEGSRRENRNAESAYAGKL